MEFGGFIWNYLIYGKLCCWLCFEKEPAGRMEWRGRKCGSASLGLLLNKCGHFMGWQNWLRNPQTQGALHTGILLPAFTQNYLRQIIHSYQGYSEQNPTQKSDFSRLTVPFQNKNCRNSPVQGSSSLGKAPVMLWEGWGAGWAQPRAAGAPGRTFGLNSCGAVGTPFGWKQPEPGFGSNPQLGFSYLDLPFCTPGDKIYKSLLQLHFFFLNAFWVFFLQKSWFPYH